LYLSLDEDQNGLLNQAEFSRFCLNGAMLSDRIVSQVFQELRMFPKAETGELEMDYKTYLDFVLAFEHLKDVQGMVYFFRLLDLYHVGYLSVGVIRYWFESITRKANDKFSTCHDTNYDVDEIVCNEIIDMVNPLDPQLGVTFSDLVRSRVGHTFISILIDVNAFIRYDTRESLQLPPPEE
jgi:Ca2+-binding EF-hand superfamily protein